MLNLSNLNSEGVQKEERAQDNSVEALMKEEVCVGLEMFLFLLELTLVVSSLFLISGLGLGLG